MVKKGLLASILFVVFLFGCSSNNEEIENVAKETEEPTSDTKNNDQSTVDEDNIEEATLPTASLKKLDEGEDVQHLQQILKDIGFPIEISGTYDQQTTWAITEIQLNEDSLYINGVYDENVKNVIETYTENGTTVEEPYTLEEPKHAEFETEDVENPYEILSVVNKTYALPYDYEPEDLTVPEVRCPVTEDDPKKQLRQEAADALEDLFANAEQVGIQLFAQSGFRSYERQEAIFAANVDQHGEEHANTYSARPGESEHQTGLVMDITSESVDFDLITDFGETDEGKWVAEHAHEYGFIIRYLDGKEDITRYQYEPWHLRYVGVEAATEMKENEITLEEYLHVE